MIKLVEISEMAKKCFFEDGQNTIFEDKIRIFIRLDSSLDIYIISTDISIFDEEYFVGAFSEYLKKNDVGSINDYKINIQVFSPSELNDRYVSAIFRSKPVVNQGDRYRLNTILSKNEAIGKSSMNYGVPIVSFYSYKGGMGRTTTMISYAIDLAMQNKKVLVVDCDLEAPGYLNFFDLSKHSQLLTGKKNGFVEFLSDIQFYNDVNKVPINDYVINLSFGNKVGDNKWAENIYIIPAGNLNETEIDFNYKDEDKDKPNQRTGYLEGLSRINLTDTSVILESFDVLIKKITHEISPDIILLDSRTGFNDIIGAAALNLSTAVVGFFGNSAQTTPGLLTLLDLYANNEFNLFLVNSILPDNPAQSSLFEQFKKKVSSYLEEIVSDFDFRRPFFSKLRRDEKLEFLGTPKDVDSDYYSMIASRCNQDYNVLFDQLNDSLGLFKRFETNIEPEVEGDATLPSQNLATKINLEYIKQLKAWQLRNSILQSLREKLSSVASFAEQAPISEGAFFYRNCMNELFDENKFLIRGYKGTGKTYLYKALAEDGNGAIAKNIRRRANVQRHENHLPAIDEGTKLIFIDVISVEPGGNKSFDFSRIEFNKIDNPDYFFSRLWQIYTWNSILLDSSFLSIRNSSKLRDYVQDIANDDCTIKRFKTIINELGLDAFIAIDDDMRKVNQFLVENNSKLFIMYDQLDTKIQPKNWDKGVSPLINYWRDNWMTYSNILPKVFVRTDLFKRIRGTNTARLEDNVINIEWTIDEIFAYFIKLVMSDDRTTAYFWELMGRIGRGYNRPGKYKTVIEQGQKELTKNNNQFKSLGQEYLTPYLTVLFGAKVEVGGRERGVPYDYFKQELSNADRNSISLRPFINTFSDNAIDCALQVLIPGGYVTDLIPSSIYASREVRIKTANSYFDDLSNDVDYSTDLTKFRDYLQTDQGIPYRYKTLSEKKFNELLRSVVDTYVNELIITRNSEDLKILLFANGIMAEEIARGEKIYRFAPMYYYAWGLTGTKYDKTNKFDVED